MEKTVVKLKSEEMRIQNIDHLGIVAGIIDAIVLVEIINELIIEEKGEKISAGHVVKAMILNGLGFVSKPLYMFPQYFETIACEHLIGAGVKPEYLSHDLKQVITLLSNLSPTVTFWEANYHKTNIKIQEFQNLSAIPKKDEDIFFMDKYWKIFRIIHELENNHIDIYLEEE
ncbi:MAG: DUF4277 domain-containing protein [Fischerella sp. CENA71]|nr:DUF4277 domain-containing protein [Fischerella sp. CENA71]